VKKNSDQKAWLLGVGLDTSDEHKRLTKGENFVLVGGSEATHDQMTEGAIKFNETLQKKGKRLEEIDRQEFKDIARETGLVKE
jgi:hypothetical protein